MLYLNHHCNHYLIQNILLFAFSSHQIVAFFPMIYDSGKDLLLGNTDLSNIFSSVASLATSTVASSMEDASNLFFSQFIADPTHSPYDLYCDAPANPAMMLTSFKPPAE